MPEAEIFRSKSLTSHILLNALCYSTTLVRIPSFVVCSFRICTLRARHHISIDNGTSTMRLSGKRKPTCTHLHPLSSVCPHRMLPALRRSLPLVRRASTDRRVCLPSHRCSPPLLACLCLPNSDFIIASSSLVKCFIVLSIQ